MCEILAVWQRYSLFVATFIYLTPIVARFAKILITPFDLATLISYKTYKAIEMYAKIK